MPSTSTLVAFGLTAIVFVAVPGPNLFYILGHGVAGGRRHAVAAALGVEIGTVIHVLAAAAGLSGILGRSTTAFEIVRYAGIAYLVWLAGRAFRSNGALAVEGDPVGGPRESLTKGIVVNLLNPKAALFFVALLPQFVEPDGDPMSQSVVLGAVLFVIALTLDLVYALGAARLGRRLRREASRSVIARTTGGVYLVLAVGALVAGRAG